MNMQDKNSKLAKENNDLKMIISQKMQMQEEIMKKSIKAEYNQILSYKQMLKTLDESITSIENALNQCKTIRQTILNNKRLLSDSTNIIRQANGESKTDISGCTVYHKENSMDGNNVVENRKVLKRNKTRNDFISESDLKTMNETNAHNPTKSKDIEKELFNKWGK
ncbi:uncharacterized protein VICG_00364 [Vittaforma corneae ATCC 50505]|uniref:Uncharacterized protein n=1 Tax=Vittaforma corneae (strain ATCC 50505) TaxID=993615 RepID=L2GQM7_VITCO|nr:uncharacterized protein VICG_00364 [Vittaforma corneae ATCC 50505]ELA42612.1 hypothetical protein VICG_00364 [Vittaforma corneae ATCC 50505]